MNLTINAPCQAINGIVDILARTAGNVMLLVDRVVEVVKLAGTAVEELVTNVGRAVQQFTSELIDLNEGFGE